MALFGQVFAILNIFGLPAINAFPSDVLIVALLVNNVLHHRAVIMFFHAA